MTLSPAFKPAVTAVLGLLLLAPAALAAGGESTKLDFSSGGTAPKATVDSGGGGIVRTIVGLAVVIGVIYGLTWVLKQLKGNREEKASGQGLAPLAALPLGGNRSVQLIRVGQEIVLVGIGEAGVTPLRTYSIAEARGLGLPVDGDGPGLPGSDDTRATARAAFAQAGDRGTPLNRMLGELRKRTVIR
jgi:flagellar protein FliO/FliZ